MRTGVAGAMHALEKVSSARLPCLPSAMTPKEPRPAARTRDVTTEGAINVCSDAFCVHVKQELRRQISSRKVVLVCKSQMNLVTNGTAKHEHCSGIKLKKSDISFQEYDFSFLITKHWD